jgi:hypothetical protein
MRKNRLCQTSALAWLALLPVTLILAQTANASGPFDGNWMFKHSCDGAAGPYAESCLRGDGDFFALVNLTQDGDRICGRHLLTAYGQKKVDEGDLGGDSPSIYGTVARNVATVRFRSTWTGTTGTATITLDKASIVWHVTEPIKEQNAFPTDAVLSAGMPNLPYRSTSCGAAPDNVQK